MACYESFFEVTFNNTGGVGSLHTRSPVDSPRYAEDCSGQALASRLGRLSVSRWSHHEPNATNGQPEIRMVPIEILHCTLLALRRY